MPYAPVPKDLSKVKNKFAFGMTVRQLISIGCAILLGLPIYFICLKLIGMTVSLWIMMFIMVPCFFAGFYEKDGRPIEVYIKNYIVAKYIRPGIRPFKTDNAYDIINQKVKINKEILRYAANHRKKSKTSKKIKSIQNVDRSRKKDSGKNDKAIKKGWKNTQDSTTDDTVPSNV
ncbi:PrgI family protein (plasmid) [Oscillospiraceae bacterium PP1C4]